MSHEVETMAYNSAEKPWHGLGVPVSNDLSVQEMMVASGTDWTVKKLGTFVETKVDGKTKRIPTGMKALVRESDLKVLSPSVGPNWAPIQNEEAFGFFKDYVEAGAMSMETAGSLKEGRIVWVLAKVGKSFDLFKGDVVESYLLFSNSHQYGKSTMVDFTPIRVVCNNTLTLALSKKSKASVMVTHRSEFDAEKVRTLMGLASQRLDDYKEAAQFLGSKKATAEKVTEYFNDIFPVHGKDSEKETSKLAKIAQQVLVEQPGAKYAEGSWWAAFNSVTYMADHVLCRDQETRLGNAWFGSTKDTKVKGLTKAIEYANAA